jgi:AraC family transcriptional activator of pobA
MRTVSKTNEANLVTMQNVNTGNVHIDYSDDDIAVVDNVRELPNANSMQLDMIMVLVCSKGRLQLDINGVQHIIEANEKLFCSHYNVISNYMLSPDFEGKAFCLSYQLMQRILHADRDIWNRLYYLERNPVQPIDEEEQHLFQNYYDLGRTMTNRTIRTYHKEVMIGIAQSALYAMLGGLKDVPDVDTNILRQPDQLFHKFKELLAEDNGLHRGVDYYAQKLCVTAKYLTVVCKQKNGHTASEMIRDNTVDRIRYQLKNSDKSVKEIVSELDFPNISFFGKFVRKHLGISPTNYRKNIMAEKDEQ